MQCAACRHQNPSDARFCSVCGAALARPCGACQAALPEGARFCPECGGAVEASAQAEPEQVPASEGERRHLTVLFCDLVGSTGTAQDLDPEDWRDAVRRYQRTVVAAVDRFDGYVAQYLGDGVLVYFGYPHAHEDDPERAVRCGIQIRDGLPALNEELQAAHGVTFAIRIGIHSGHVVVGEMGGGEHRETLALGDTTNVAAHIQALAEPGTVVMSGRTQRLVSGIFVTRDLGSHVLKGQTRPTPVHLAIAPSGMRSRLAVTDEADLTPLVGRDAELAVLEDRWTQVCEGRGQAVLIAGEPGIGKSRLVHAFRHRIADRAHTWLEGSASPYYQDSPFHAVLQLHRESMGFAPGTPSETRAERLEAALRLAGFDLAETMPLLAALHGLPLPTGYAPLEATPEVLRARTFETLAEWLLLLGRQQPVVLLIEDLHWMDPSTIELLETILEQIPSSRLLLALTFRPEFEPPWAARSHIATITLPRISSSQLRELIRGAAREGNLPEATIDEIASRSDGVPLFAEELTRTVVESSSDESAIAAVPDTLQDSLMARLDRLNPVKRVAQMGSVIGREFHYSLIRALWPDDERGLRSALRDAVQAEFFFQRGSPPEASFVFKHALIRDAAYESLLRKTRRRLHGQLAHTLEDHGRPELVAQHRFQAGDTAGAFESWLRAGELATSRAAHLEAIQHFEGALRALAELPADASRDERELTAQQMMGRSLVSARGWADPDTSAAWTRARELCDPAQDPVRHGAIAVALADGWATAGELDRALGILEEALALGERSGEELVTIASHTSAAMALYYLGRYREAQDHLERAQKRYQPERHDFLAAGFHENKGVNLMSWAAWIQWQLGLTERAWQSAERAIEIARRHDDPFGLSFAVNWASVTALLLRDFAAARDLGGEAARLAGEQGSPMLEALARMTEHFSIGILGEDPDASTHFAPLLGQAAATGSRLGTTVILAFLVELQLSEGRVAEATGMVEMALASGREAGQPCFDARLLELKGLCLQRAGGDDEAVESLLREAVETAHSQGALSFELRAATSLARTLGERGRAGEGAALLTPILAGLPEGRGLPDGRDADALLAELTAR